MGNDDKVGGKSFPEEGTMSIEALWRNPTWCIRGSRRKKKERKKQVKKKKVEAEPDEQGKS